MNSHRNEAPRGPDARNCPVLGFWLGRLVLGFEGRVRVEVGF